ncbi:hypothetical protein I4U23_022242 [Adineta vaga]|nr:hypothetical protein I4U23_022242 [Adineta vaga]
MTDSSVHFDDDAADGGGEGRVQESTWSSSMWLMVTALCSIPIILLIAACVIVISLLTLYLPERGSDIRPASENDVMKTFNTVFGTNLVAGTENGIVKYDSIAQQINEKLGYTSDILSIISATFGSSQNANGRKKRQSSAKISCNAAFNGTQQNADNGNSLGLVFRINKCPKTKCLTSYCIGKCASQVQLKIQTVLGSTAFSLNIETTAGMLSLSAQFCSTGPSVSGKKD